jgi:hypothetical protein
LADRFLEAPPTRQRVVERDGRLLVIDSGARAIGRSAPATAPAMRGFRRTAFDGRGVLATRRWYDDKGPRQLSVDPVTGRIARLAPIAATIVILALIGVAIAFPYVLVAIPVLVQPKPWQRLRARITAYLDRFEPAA